jgi:hypothetical protein
MADINLKTETPDTSLPTTGFLFGADSQAAASPSVYTTQAVATTLLGSTTLSGATITADAPVLNMSQTWNNAAVTFTSFKLNITDTASAVVSTLMDIGTGGGTYVSKFSVRRDGTVAAASSITAAQFVASSIGAILSGTTGGNLGLGGTGGSIYFTPTNNAQSTADTILTRRGAANLRLGAADTTGTTAPTPQFLSAQSWLSSTTNNQTGANFTIDGSQGTGTGAGGSIIFRVARAGAIANGVQNALEPVLKINSTGTGTLTFGTLQYTGFSFGTGGEFNIDVIGTISFKTASSGAFIPPAALFGWASSALPTNGTGTIDLALARDTSNTLALRNGANAQAFRVYNTFTDATNFERANIFWDSNVLKIGTEKGSVGGTARALEFQTDGTTRLTIASTGAATFTGNIAGVNFISSGNYMAATAGYVFWNGRCNIDSPANGNIRLTNAAVNDFDRLQFGGTTSSFPALKRSSASLIVRLADDSANAALESASLKTDAPTGGTAATWKLGTVASVSPTSPNRTIEVDIGGTIYYLHAKTTND